MLDMRETRPSSMVRMFAGTPWYTTVNFASDVFDESRS